MISTCLCFSFIFVLTQKDFSFSSSISRVLKMWFLGPRKRHYRKQEERERAGVREVKRSERFHPLPPPPFPI